MPADKSLTRNGEYGVKDLLRDLRVTPTQAARWTAARPAWNPATKKRLGLNTKIAKGIQRVLDRVPPPTPEHARTCYCVWALGTDFVKIGTCRGTGIRPVLSRLQQLRTCSPFELRLLYLFWYAEYPAGKNAERLLHKKFSADRIRGEWFRLRPSVADYLSSLPGFDLDWLKP